MIGFKSGNWIRSSDSCFMDKFVFCSIMSFFLVIFVLFCITVDLGVSQGRLSRIVNTCVVVSLPIYFTWHSVFYLGTYELVVTGRDPYDFILSLTYKLNGLPFNFISDNLMIPLLYPEVRINVIYDYWSANCNIIPIACYGSYPTICLEIISCSWYVPTEVRKLTCICSHSHQYSCL